MEYSMSKELIKYQKEEEQKILSQAENNREKQRLQQMYETLKVTSTDLSRIYSYDEVKLLCRRTKVRVDMTLYNCVWDAKRRLDKKNRLDNRSARYVNAMLVKAVRRGMVRPYSEAEIAKCNHIRSCQLKKDNNCRLDRWRYDMSVHVESSESPASSVQLELPIEEATDPQLWDSELEIDGEDWAEAAMHIDTESMIIDSIEPLQEPSLFENSNMEYAMFNTQIPSTSTQATEAEKQ